MVWPRKNIFAEYTQPVPPRFYVPEARAEESTIVLPADEAMHLTRVLRLSRGDQVRVFNGRGDEWDALVDDTRKDHATVLLQSKVRAAPEPRVAITLAAAVLKGDKMDDVVRDAVMLGVHAIIPLLTVRSEVARTAIERSGRVARWQRIAIASVKQCGRAVVPEVMPLDTFDNVIEKGGNVVMLVEPSTGAGAVALREMSDTASTGPKRLMVVVGPEGGWTAEEVQHARKSGDMLLTLGAQTLRADALPIVALTALRVRMEDL
jgi:16S rRNA (uracil1498-N3)-methyltransferase